MAVLCHGIVMWINQDARLETDRERVMLHAENQDRLYLITPPKLDAATQQRLAQEDITATPDMSAYQGTTRALVACP